jgi:Ethanolamine utilization protein EutJ (predicted chaperonin)
MHTPACFINTPVSLPDLLITRLAPQLSQAQDAVVILVLAVLGIQASKEILRRTANCALVDLTNSVVI